MSTRISMVLTDEARVPHGESFIASCTLEFDEEPSQPKDIETFRSQVHSAIAACWMVIGDEFKATRANP